MSVMGLNKHYTRRINQQGNSLSVGIPAELAQKLKIEKGQELEVIYVEEKEEIILKKKRDMSSFGVDTDFMNVLNSVLDDYDEAIKNLKDR